MGTYLLFFLFICVKNCFCFEVFSTTATAVGVTGAVGAVYGVLKCKYYECCNDDWIKFDESKLIKSLKTNLFGQHLAQSAVPSSVHGFLKNPNPRKALVLSFSGLTGSGKNYVANMIANSIYKEGTSSSFVHLYSGVKDFPHKQLVSRYHDRIREEIVKFTKECERSLFIFDEVDKMPAGAIDAVQPFIDYYDQLDGINFRKNIFIFLSNAGASSIVKTTMRFWADGRDREEITLKDIEPEINKGAFNEEGGFQFSNILTSELVDTFVPFLPLERKHVYQCIEAELISRGKKVDNSIVRKVADDLVYFPEENEMYSKSGCKRIAQKIDLYVD